MNELDPRTAQATAQAMYDTLHTDITEDVIEAALWARKVLTYVEGAGHILQLSVDTGEDDDTEIACELYKPEWPGSHVGAARPSGSEAIAWAVCEYLADTVGLTELPEVK